VILYYLSTWLDVLTTSGQPQAVKIHENEITTATPIMRLKTALVFETVAICPYNIIKITSVDGSY
jgi:hypothetical protein